MTVFVFSTTVIVSPGFNVVPSGTLIVKLPSLSTVPVTLEPSGNVTSTVLPGVPLPVTVLSPLWIGSTVGWCAVFG